MGKNGAGIVEERDGVMCVWRGEMDCYDRVREEDRSAVRDATEERRRGGSEGVDHPHASARCGEEELKSGCERSWMCGVLDM